MAVRRMLLGLLVVAGLASALEMELNEKPENQQQCQGMYSRKSWGGATEPYVMTKFMPYKQQGEEDPNKDPILAAIVFEYTDEHLIGVPAGSGSDQEQRQYVCDEQAIEDRHCTREDFGTFILAANATAKSHAKIRTQAVHLRHDDRGVLNIDIQKTGYYCVSTAAFGDFPYTAIVEFRNAYGELPGAQIAKLPFYGGLAIVYAALGAFWAFLYAQHRRDILPVQNYITATIVFLVVEMIATWGYYDHMNRNGSDLGSKILVIVVSVLNAVRNSLSFFLLLIVCMGYGVVHASLGKKMLYARLLAITHFIFGIIYAIASLSITPEDAGPLVLLVVLPLAATLTAFYVWTLNSLSATMKDLLARKQRVKALMYRKLWWCILGSVLVIFAFFFLNSFTFAGQGDPGFTPNHWQTRWFVLDGWLNLVYLGDVAFIAYLWRPTANNRRFAMSDELAQDDEGFEIASVRSSMDSEDNRDTKPASEIPHYAPNGTANGSATLAPNNNANNANNNNSRPTTAGGSTYASYGSAPRRTDSPLPAPTPQRPIPRQSIENETIFAVGGEGDDEEDEDSDGSERDDGGGGRRLVRKDD